jgi:hypothetical protein
MFRSGRAEGQEGLYFRMITAKVCPEGCVEVEAGQGSQITSPSLVLSCNSLLCFVCDGARSEQITTIISDAPDDHFLLPALPNPSIVPGRQKGHGPLLLLRISASGNCALEGSRHSHTWSGFDHRGILGLARFQVPDDPGFISLIRSATQSSAAN